MIGVILPRRDRGSGLPEAALGRTLGISPHADVREADPRKPLDVPIAGVSGR